MSLFEQKTIAEVVDKGKKFPVVDGPFGTQLHADEYVSDGVPVVRVSNLTYEGRFLPEDLVFITEKKATKLSRSAITQGDLIVAKTGATIGKAALYPYQQGIVASSCLKASFDANLADPRFVLYKIISAEGQRKIIEGASGSTRTTINITPFSQIHFSFPPIEHQKKIAEVLTAVDQAITQTETLIAKYQRIKTGLMQDLLMQGIDENGNLRDPATHEFKEVEGYGRIPVEWGTGYLNEVIDSFRPIVYGILMPGYGYENGIPVIKVKDIFNGKVDSSDLLLTDPKIDQLYKRSRLQTGDLLFTIRGTVGRMAFVPAELDGANITQDTARICVTKAYPLFIRYYLDSFRAKTFIELHTLGQAVKGINLGDVRKIPIALPPKVEQERIANALLVCDDMIKNELTNVSKLNKLKTGLMQDLLTGKVSVAPLLENNRN